MKKLSDKKLSLIIAVLYVGLGTIFSYLYWSSYNPMASYEIFGEIMFYLFFPVSFISIVISFTESEPHFYIFLTQLVTFFIARAIIYSLVSIIRPKRK